MAKDDIPIKESTQGGVPFDGSVRGAQKAIQQSLLGTRDEQPREDEVETEATEEVSAQDTKSESVQTEVANPDGLTADDIVDNNQEEVSETPDMYTIKVDGKDVEVTLDELMSGYSRQADYTRKSQVLSEQRKKADEELAATQQERQRYLSQLEQLSSTNKSEIETLKSTDWEKLKLTNQTDYLLKKDRYDDLLAQEKAIVEQTKKVEQDQASDFKKKWNESLEENKKLIVKKIPKYFDAKEGTQIQTSIRDFGVSEGLTNDELDSMIDARSVNILYKAMLYDQLLNTKISSKKSKVVPKYTKPGTPATRGEISSDKVKAQRARLRKTGNVKDASSLLESILKS